MQAGVRGFKSPYIISHTNQATHAIWICIHDLAGVNPRGPCKATRAGARVRIGPRSPRPVPPPLPGPVHFPSCPPLPRTTSVLPSRHPPPVTACLDWHKFTLCWCRSGALPSNVLYGTFATLKSLQRRLLSGQGSIRIVLSVCLMK